MYARIDLPEFTDLDTAIRDFRKRFDKVSEVYYPQKDAKGRRGSGDFLFADTIKKWDFISHWCEIFENDDEPPLCELSLATHDPKSFVKFAKQFPDLMGYDQPFYLSQSIHHRHSQNCYLTLMIDKFFAYEKNLTFSIEETARKAKGQKLDPAAIEIALGELWEPTAENFAEATSLTITPSVSGTKFKAKKSEAKFRAGRLELDVDNNGELAELVSKWAKWSCKLPKSIKVMYWSFQGEFPESEALKVHRQLRKLFGEGIWLKFTGKYRKDFKIESVIGKFPAEGYWRFPLFRATAGLVGAHELVQLVLTPNGNFFEYGDMSEQHLERFKKHKNFKGPSTIVADPYGCVLGTKTFNELFNED